MTKNLGLHSRTLRDMLPMIFGVLAIVVTIFGVTTAFADPSESTEPTPPLELTFGQDSIDIDPADPNLGTINLSPTLVSHEATTLTDVAFELVLPKELAIAGDAVVTASNGENQTLDESALAENRVAFHFDKLTFSGDANRTAENPTDLSMIIPVQLISDQTPMIMPTVAVGAAELEDPLVANQVMNIDVPVTAAEPVADPGSTDASDGVELTSTAPVKVLQDGSTYNWGIQVNNNSGDEVTDLNIVDNMTEGVSFDTVDVNAIQDTSTYGNVTYTIGNANQAASINVPKVPSERSASVSLLCKVPERASESSIPGNSDKHPEDKSVDNKASATLTVKSKKVSLEASSTIQVRKPRLSIAKAIKGGMSASGEATITIKVANISAGTAAEGLEITETVPEGVQIISEPIVQNGFVANVAGHTITIKTDQDNPGVLNDTQSSMEAEYQVKVDKSASNSLTIKTDATAKNSTADTAAQDLSAPGTPHLSLDVTVAPTKAQAGATVTYTYAIDNDSGVDVEGAVITDTLPDGISWKDCAEGTIEGKKLTINVGSVKGSEQGDKARLITATAVIDEDTLPTGPSGLSDSALITWFDGSQTDSDSRSTTVVVVAPELTVEKSCNRSFISPGDRVYYTITISNPEGFPTIHDLDISDPLPDGLTLGKDIAISDSSIKYTTDNNTLTLDRISALNPGQTITIVFDAQVASNLTDGMTLDNIVNATSPDIGDVDDTAGVGGLTPGINVLHETDVKKAQPGDSVPIKLTVANGNSDTPLRSAVIDVTIPEEAHFSNFTTKPDGVEYNTDGHSLTINVGDIAANGAPVELVYEVVPDEVTEEPITINASASALGVEPKDVPVSFDIDVPVLTLEKTVDKATEVKVGDTVNYTVTVNNDSDLPAKNVTVEDFLAPGLSLVDAPTISSENSDNGFTVEETDSGWQAKADVMPANTMLSFVYSCTVDSMPASGLKNTTTLTANNVEPITKEATITGNSASLQIGIEAASNSIAVDGLNDLTITVKNPSAADISGVKIGSSLPTGLKLSGTPTKPTQGDFGDPETTEQAFTISGGTIKAGESVQVKFAIQCTEIPPALAQFSVPATVEANGVSSTTAIVKINAGGPESALSHLSIAKNSVENGAVAGNGVTFIITVTNPVTAPQVPTFNITDTLPTGMTFSGQLTITNSDGSTTTVDPSSSTSFSQPINGLAGGSSVTIQYATKISDSIADGTSLVNTASIADTSGNTILSATATTMVSGQQQVLASKMADTGIPALGGGLGFVGVAAFATWLLRRKSN